MVVEGLAGVPWPHRTWVHKMPTAVGGRSWWAAARLGLEGSAAGQSQLFHVSLVQLPQPRVGLHPSLVMDAAAFVE